MCARCQKIAGRREMRYEEGWGRYCDSVSFCISGGLSFKQVEIFFNFKLVSMQSSIPFNYGFDSFQFTYLIDHIYPVVFY